MFFWSFIPASCPKWIRLILITLHTRVKSKSWNSSQVLRYSLTRNFRVLHAWHKHLKVWKSAFFMKPEFFLLAYYNMGMGRKINVWFSLLLLVQLPGTIGDPTFYRIFLYASLRHLKPWAGACCMSCIYACMLCILHVSWCLSSLTDRLVKADLVVYRELNMIYWTSAMWY